MATVGGLSGGTSSSINMYGTSMKGYGGLASGLDTDSLIQGMTQGTRTKIQEALKKKDKYQWQMDSYRSISDKLISFSKKYLDVTNTNSPYRAGFFDKTLATAMGANSGKVSVSGTSTALDNMSVLGVKQLAKDTGLVTSNNSSDQILQTGDINFGTTQVSKLNGGNMTIEYDGQSYNLNFTEGSKVVYREKNTGDFKEATIDFSSVQNTKDSINALLNSADLRDASGNIVKDSNGKNVKLGSKVEFTEDGTTPNNNFALKHTLGTDATKLKITGGSEDAMKALGFMKDDKSLVNDGLVETGQLLKGETEAKLETICTERKFADFMADKQITFSYNGVAKSIKLPKEKTDPAFANDVAFADYLNKELATAFGSGKIKVDASTPDTSLSFTTTDSSSILKITDADKDIMGKTGILGIGYGETNRLNREDGLAQSGLKGIPAGFGSYYIDKTNGEKVYTEFVTDENGVDKTDSNGNKIPTGYNSDPTKTMYDSTGKLMIEVNGKKVEGLTVDSTLLQVTSAINASDAGIKLTYVETADRFSMTATNHGEAGKIEFGAAGSTTGPMDFLKTLFGTSGNPADGTDYTLNKGQDAIMVVKYEGNTEMTIKRDTNSFNLDGATFTLNGTFGYKAQVDANGDPIKDAQGNIQYDQISDTEEIKFTTAVDSDKVTKVIKELIDDYNTVLEETFKQVSTKPDRKYGPLTDDEKSQLTSDEIKKLEDKAKEGILFNDSLLRSLSDQLRSVFSGVTDTGTLKEMGIVMSGDYAANGKISFDEEAFKSALSENPDKIKELFTKPAEKDAAGEIQIQGGFAVRLKQITESFAKATGIPKGSLIDKAGSTASPTSVLQNSLKTLMDDLDDQVERFKDKLQIEIDRYTKQFSSLEQLIAQMNSQSSWLSQATGG